MTTKAKYRNGVLTMYDSSTFESFPVGAPALFYDDFQAALNVIPAAGSEESGMPWSKKIVGAAPPTVAGVADQAGGVVACTLTSDSQKQDAGLYFGDDRQFDVSKGLNFEARIKLSVLPTLVAEAVFGVVGDWADGPDNITYSVMFSADGSGAITCETDDNSTDSGAVSSGVTATNTQWKIYRIDCTDVTDLKFYIDGAEVAAATTFAYAATGANAILQPYIGMYKASGAGVGTIQVDYVKLWQSSR